MIITADRDQRRPRPRCFAEARVEASAPGVGLREDPGSPLHREPGRRLEARLTHDQLQPIITDERELQRRWDHAGASDSARRSTATPGRACAGSSAAAATQLHLDRSGLVRTWRIRRPIGRVCNWTCRRHANRSPGRRRAVPRRRSVERSHRPATINFGRGCFGRRIRRRCGRGVRRGVVAASARSTPGHPTYPAGTVAPRSACARGCSSPWAAAFRSPVDAADGNRRRVPTTRSSGSSSWARFAWKSSASDEPPPSSRSASAESVSPWRTVTVGLVGRGASDASGRG